MFDYPVFLRLDGIDVLVVGGGRIGQRKIAALAAHGALVRLVAPDVAPGFDRNTVVEHRRRAFRPSDLEGVRLVVTATGDAAIDADVAAAATARGLWVNAADQPADCTFILPAIARAGRVTIAVSTDGASPALAGWTRDLAAALLTAELAELAERLAEQRAAIRANGGSTEDVDWRTIIDHAMNHSTSAEGV